MVQTTAMMGVFKNGNARNFIPFTGTTYNTLKVIPMSNAINALDKLSTKKTEISTLIKPEILDK